MSSKVLKRGEYYVAERAGLVWGIMGYGVEWTGFGCEPADPP